MSLEGIDISYANNPTPPLGAYAFVFVKAGQYNFQDSMWAKHAAAVQAAGKVLGAYWFYDDRASAASQAAMFLSIAGGADLLVLDFESPATNTTGAKAFIAAVQKAGHKIGLYHSASGFPDFGQDWNWVAKWSTTPPANPWAFWQYSGTGLDRDRFNGDATALATLAGTTSAGPIQGDIMLAPITDKTPGTCNIPAGETLYAEDGKTVAGKTVGATAVVTPFGSGPLRAFLFSRSLGVWGLHWAAPTTGSFKATVAAPAPTATPTTLAPGLYQVKA